MSSVLTELHDGVLHVRLNRSQVHNALDGDLVESLHAAIDAAGRDKTARVVVLEGEGKSFCAGADLEWMRKQGEASRSENERSARRLAELYEKLSTLRLPVVARVQGPAIGGGVGLVAASDIAVASKKASFSFAEVRLGLVPAVISPHVIRKIGMSLARELILTGRRIDAGEALRIGLVHRLAGEENLDEAVAEIVRDLKAGGPEALARAKRLLEEVSRLLHGSPSVLADYTAAEIAAARASAEGRTGTTAFLEKKPPPWLKDGGK